MQIELDNEDGALVVRPLDTRIDAHVAGAFRTALITQIEAGHRNVIIDLARVTFIDSSGLGAVVSALKRIGRDGDLRVRSLTDGVRTMFELTRLNRVIPVAPEPTAAR